MSNAHNLVSAIEFMNRFKQIERLSIISKNGRKESDAEHTWHMVMTLWLLSESYEKKVDLGKAIKIALVHDLPEILTGDVFAHSTEITKEQKKENELKSINEIVSQLPEKFGKEIKQLWDEYEERETDEAKFVWLVDKLMSRIQYRLTDGDHSDELDYDKEEDIAQTEKMKQMSQLFSDLLTEIGR